jgi:hypothetical protein
VALTAAWFPSASASQTAWLIARFEFSISFQRAQGWDRYFAADIPQFRRGLWPHAAPQRKMHLEKNALDLEHFHQSCSDGLRGTELMVESL